MQSQTARAAAQDNDMWDPPGWMVIEQANNNDRPTEYTGPAGARVVDIVEIFGMILLEFPPSAMFQLFAMQRVSKAFQGTIAGSKKLQRRMFLLPDERLRKARLNPFIAKCAFSPKAGFDWRSANSLLIPIYRHVLPHEDEQDERLYEWSEEDLGREVMHRHQKVDSELYPKSRQFVERRYPLPKNNSALLTGEGAPGWTRMLITQPAMPSFPDDVVSRLRTRFDNIGVNGLKVGQLLEAIEMESDIWRTRWECRELKICGGSRCSGHSNTWHGLDHY